MLGRASRLENAYPSPRGEKENSARVTWIITQPTIVKVRSNNRESSHSRLCPKTPKSHGSPLPSTWKWAVQRLNLRLTFMEATSSIKSTTAPHAPARIMLRSLTQWTVECEGTVASGSGLHGFFLDYYRFRVGCREGTMKRVKPATPDPSPGPALSLCDPSLGTTYGEKQNVDQKWPELPPKVPPTYSSLSSLFARDVHTLETPWD